MMPGIAKTDAIDAEVIARTAMGMPRALGPIAAEDAAARSLRALSSQRERVGGVREGRRRGRGRLGAHAGARDIRAGLRRRRARRAHRRGAGRRRGRREPARDTRHRAEDRRGAGHAVDISLFGSHREPAGYRGAAPADSGSDTGIRSTSPQRGGSKQLENLLIFSRSPLVGTRNRFGRRYDERRARGGWGATRRSRPSRGRG